MNAHDSVREYASWVPKEMHEPGYGAQFEGGDAVRVEADGVLFVQADYEARHSEVEWLGHPAVIEVGGWFLRIAGWALGDSALDAVLAAEVAPEYARAAHRAGVTDARALIDAWEAGIPIEYLGAAS